MRRAVLARPVWLAAAISIGAATFPAVAGAAGSLCTPGAGPPLVDPTVAGGVNIHMTANNSVIWCSAQVIGDNADIPNGTSVNYPLRSSSQSPNNNPVSNAIFISHLLTVAGIAPATVNHTEIMRVNGSWTSLDNTDLTAPAASFVDGLAPIFFLNGAQTFYLRPLRSPSDTNGDEEISASNGAALDFYVYSGPLLDVIASANPKTVATHHPVTLTAQVTNATAADRRLTYTWNFQDGTTATGQTVTHAYAVAGTWYPVVTVLGTGNDSGGASQPVPVTVGSVPTGPGAGTRGGANPGKHAPHGGSAHGRGNASNGAPTHTNTGGANTHTASKTARTGTTPAPTTTPHTESPTLGGGATIGGRTRRGATTGGHGGKAVIGVGGRTAPVQTKTQPSSALGGPVVDGRLISDVVPISAAQLAQQSRTAGQPASSGSAAAARLGGDSIPALVRIGGVCAVILLFGAGAALELRSQRRAATL
jgi:hypothetical protein